MKLSAVLQHLTNGELAGLDIGGAEVGGVVEEHHDKIIGFVNLGMSDLYTRFPIKRSELTLQMVEGTLDYPIEPAGEEVLIVTAVLDEAGDNIIFDDPSTVYLPYPTILHVVEPDPTEQMVVRYHAKPDIIADGSDPTATELLLPYQLLSPLLAYVGHRAHLSSVGDSSVKADKYLAKYLGLCKDVRLTGMLSSQVGPTDKFADQGWV